MRPSRRDRSAEDRLTSWQVATAAEAIAAAQFARLGFDVSVQYGANQPEYDLLIARGNAIRRVSVKGSQNGAWGLTQGLKKGRSYHEAADEWCRRHQPGTLLCLVQFEGVLIGEMPRVFVATPQEIARRLKETRLGLGETILYEDHTWKGGPAKGTRDRIPDTWRMSAGRMAGLLAGT